MKSYDLTLRQREVFDFVRGYIERNKRAPYIREIQQGCGIFSYKAAVDKLVSLEKKGYIRRILKKHRGITVLDPVVAAMEKSPS